MKKIVGIFLGFSLVFAMLVPFSAAAQPFEWTLMREGDGYLQYHFSIIGIIDNTGEFFADHAQLEGVVIAISRNGNQVASIVTDEYGSASYMTTTLETYSASIVQANGFDIYAPEMDDEPFLKRVFDLNEYGEPDFESDGIVNITFNVKLHVLEGMELTLSGDWLRTAHLGSAQEPEPIPEPTPEPTPTFEPAPAITPATGEVRVTIDGQAVNFADQPPAVVDNRTLVPVRGVFEQLGFYVTWDGDAQQATLTREDFTVIISVGSATFTTNGASHTLDVPAQIINNRTMLPIRAVLESVGVGVDWDGGTSTVLISTESAAPT